MPEDVIDFVSPRYDKIYWNPVKHQMVRSILCGYYVLCFINYLSKGGNKITRFYDFVHKVFTNNELDNNRKVRDLFHLL